MADIGKITPGSPIIPRVPRDHPATDEKEQRQEPPEEKQQDTEEEEQNDNNNEDKDQEGGIDLYV